MMLIELKMTVSGYSRLRVLLHWLSAAVILWTSIYLIVGAVLVTGVLMMDRPINVFGVIGIAQPLSDPCLIALFVTVHTWACVVLSLLLAVHIGAVIVHEACNRRVLQRMSLRLCGKPGAGRLE